MQPPALTDGIVTLKPFSLDDVDTHVAGDDPEQIKWLNNGHPSTQQSTRNWIMRNQQHWKNNGPIFNFAIRDSDHKLMGMVEANTDTKNLIGLKPGDANVSYALYTTARGRGYASRAVLLIERFLAKQGIKRSVIRVNPANKASIAIPVRLGYGDHGIIDTDDGGLRIFVKPLVHN